jgi:hypothetical protein
MVLTVSTTGISLFAYPKKNNKKEESFFVLTSLAL